MATTVYIWTTTDSNPGHASMEVGNTYISYWPRPEETEFKDTIVNGVGGRKGNLKDFKVGMTHNTYFPKNYRADRRLEGHDCDQKITISSIDEQKIIEHWSDFKQNPRRYNMIKHNCSTVIASLLELGTGVPVQHSPNVKITQHISNKFMRWIFKLRFLGNHINMWTPNDVFKYSLQINSYKNKS